MKLEVIFFFIEIINTWSIISLKRPKNHLSTLENLENKTTEFYHQHKRSVRFYKKHQYAMKLAIHYILYENERSKIKPEVLKVAMKLLNSNLVKSKNMKYYWELFVEIIQRENDSLHFPSFLISRFICQYLIFEKNNQNPQIIKTKNDIISFLESSNDINKLYFIKQNISLNDYYKLIKAMRSSLKNMYFKKPNNNYLSILLNTAILSRLRNNISLHIVKLEGDLENYKDSIDLFSNPIVHELCIDSCKFNSKITVFKNNKNSILSSFSKSTSIEKLSIVNTKLTKNDLNCILEAVNNSETAFKKLYLVNANIEGLLLFSRLLFNNKITELMLKGYKNISKFSKNFSEFLQKNKTIKRLFFIENSVDDETLNDLLKGLEENISLVELNFNYTGFDIKDYTEILKVVANKKTNNILKISFKNVNMNIYSSALDGEKNNFITQYKRIRRKNIKLHINWFKYVNSSKKHVNFE